jgi:hypothetical protein
MSKIKTFALSAVLACSAGGAWAQSPHFLKDAPATLTPDGEAKVSFKEAGLGSNASIDYCFGYQNTKPLDPCYANTTASPPLINSSATYTCVNHGGKCPADPKKTTVVGPVFNFGTFSSGKNGAISASLKISPPGPGTFDCPGNQVATLSAVSYTGLNLKDSTNNVAATVNPTSLGPRIFFTCP